MCSFNPTTSFFVSWWWSNSVVVGYQSDALWLVLSSTSIDMVVIAIRKKDSETLPGPKCCLHALLAFHCKLAFVATFWKLSWIGKALLGSQVGNFQQRNECTEWTHCCTRVSHDTIMIALFCSRILMCDTPRKGQALISKRLVDSSCCKRVSSTDRVWLAWAHNWSRVYHKWIRRSAKSVWQLTREVSDRKTSHESE